MSQVVKLVSVSKNGQKAMLIVQADGGSTTYHCNRDGVSKDGKTNWKSADLKDENDKVISRGQVFTING